MKACDEAFRRYTLEKGIYNFMRGKMRSIVAAAFICMSATSAFAQDGVVIRCGSSTGQGYYFPEMAGAPGSGRWSEDGFSTGKIILVNLGDEWDIMFDDAIGAHSYRKDGAAVVPILRNDRFITVMALMQPNYSDIYTFDLEKREVAWSSQRITALFPKVAVYKAQCQ